MPTYEYKCNACDHRFELFQSMKDSPKRKCPECGKSALERLIGTGAAVIFKGSGFYQTDYRSDSYKKGAEAEKKSASESTTTTPATSPAAGGNGSAPATPSSSPSSAGSASSAPATPAPSNKPAGDSKSAKSSKNKPAAD